MSGNIGAASGLVLLGGFLQGSFALPMTRLPCWRWENDRRVCSAEGMLLLPWIIVFLTLPQLGETLGVVPGARIAEVILFGFGWGVGFILFRLGIPRIGSSHSWLCRSIANTLLAQPDQDMVER